MEVGVALRELLELLAIKLVALVTNPEEDRHRGALTGQQRREGCPAPRGRVKKPCGPMARAGGERRASADGA
jgi:hypothetical protein